MVREVSRFAVKAMNTRGAANENLRRYENAFWDFYVVSRSFRENGNWSQLETLSKKIEMLEGLVDN